MHMFYFDNPKVRAYALFVSLGLIVAYQAITLMVGELAFSLVADGFQQEISERVVTSQMLRDYLSQQNITKVAGRTFLIALPLLAIQVIPLLIYVSRSRIRTKLYLSWGFFLGPGFVTLPSGGLPILYLMSPFLALGYFPGFIQHGNSYEMVTEAWDAQVAAIGWFNLFWFAIALFNSLRWYARD